MAVDTQGSRRTAPLRRRALAEAVGTALLVAVVVGSGITAQELSPDDQGLQLLENALATAAGLAAIILAVGPVSGAHLNPVVSCVDRLFGGITNRDLAAYIAAQVTGALLGTVVANAMFGEPAVAASSTVRAGGGLLLAEVVATAGLILVVFGLVRSGGSAVAAAVGAYIGAAYFFTASTSFANPAVTIARMLTDTFSGIAPESVPGFLAAQLAGGAVGGALVRALYPHIEQVAGDVVVPHGHQDRSLRSPPQPPLEERQ